MTNFPDGVASYGMPMFGNLPFPTGGRVIFCDPGNTTGRASAGGGGSLGKLTKPYTTLALAYAAARSGKNDIIVFLGDGATTASERLSETLVWSKNAVHLIGVAAPTRVGQRCRITGPSTGGTFSPLVTVSGNGCYFANFSIFDDYTVDPCALKVTGQRNYFFNVNIQGMGAATGADDAAASSLWLAGGSENTFEKCTIGLDTIPRSAANSEILLTSAATRNVFVDCKIVSYCDAATHLWVDASASGSIDRYTEFRRCEFTNAKTGLSSGLTMTQGMNVHASAGGYIELYQSRMFGATDWAAADNSNVIIDGTAATAGSDGIMLAVTR